MCTLHMHVNTSLLRGVDVVEEDFCLCSQLPLSTAPLRNQPDQFGQSSFTINCNVTEIFYGALFHSCFNCKVRSWWSCSFQHLKQDITLQGADCYCCHQGAGVEAANPPQGLKTVEFLSSLGHTVSASSLTSPTWNDSKMIVIIKVFPAEEKH